MKTRWITVFVLAITASTVIVFAMIRSNENDSVEAPAQGLGRSKEEEVIPVGSQPMAQASKKKHEKNTRPRIDEDKERECGNLSAADWKTSKALQDALDGGDFKRVLAKVDAAAESQNPSVRLQAVEALQWFGQRALPELTQFMADADDEVRAAAIDAWDAGISEMPEGQAKARTVLMGLQVVMDKDQLESMVMRVDGLTDFQKLDVLTQVIDGPNKVAAEVAREHYKFWTEEDYVDLQTAQKWLDAQAE